LVTDAQRVGEALGHGQHHPVALALQQRVGGDVAPIFTAPMRSAGIGSPAASPRTSRMPCTAASR
jgi:hypothetical protein